MAGGKLTLFNRRGKGIAELNAAFHCSWVKNGAGKGNFELALSNSKATESNLRFGNLVMYEHPDLPAWGGIIRPPYKWDRGKIAISAMSGEEAFSHAVVKSTGTYTGTSRAIYKKIIRRLHKKTGFPIVGNNISGRDTSFEIDLRSQTLQAVVDTITGEGADSWWFQPWRNRNNELVFRANMAKRRGGEVDFDVIEGKNMELTSGTTEDGPIINVVKAIGESGEGDPPTFRKISQESIDLYGKNHRSIFVASSSQGELRQAAKKELRRWAFPRLRFSAKMWGSAALKTIRLGNKYPAQLNTVGFFRHGTGSRAWVKVVAMEYKAMDDAISVVFEQTASRAEIQ